MTANLIPDDEEPEVQYHRTQNNEEWKRHDTRKPSEQNNDTTANTNTQNDVTEEPLNDSTLEAHDEEALPSCHIIDDEEQENTTMADASKELLLLHYRLGHHPFSRLQEMAKDGWLPSRLARCKTPNCASCFYGKATKVPWRTKEKQSNKIFEAKAPGQVVSVDQLESPDPGLIGQMKGWLTNKRYNYATVFVDHFSRLGYVHLQQTDSSHETLMAKQAFEGYCRSKGVRVQHYHADNGRFGDNAYKESVMKSRQTISYCGVNAHFQNGVAERRIRELQEGARTALIHAQHGWSSAVNVHLWPYAVRYRNEIYNATPRKGHRRSPLEMFSSSPVRPKLKHYHTFGCPAYRVNREIQSGHGQNKWFRRAEPTVYLGPSPRHARSVSLVLDITTGHVSPQYHLKYDEAFETVSERRINPLAHRSNWQQLSGLTCWRQDWSWVQASDDIFDSRRCYEQKE